MVRITCDRKITMTADGFARTLVRQAMSSQGVQDLHVDQMWGVKLVALEEPVPQPCRRRRIQ